MPNNFKIYELHGIVSS